MYKQEKHESYGMVGLSNISSSHPVFLVGSSIRHTQFIELEITEAVKEESNGVESFFQGKDIVKILISPSQLIELITSPNSQGVPCTISRLNGKRLASPPDTLDKKERHCDFTRELFKEIIDLIKDLEVKMEGEKSLSMTKRNMYVKDLSVIKSFLTNNIDYSMEVFEEFMDKTVMQAKSEVEAYVSNKVLSLGLEVLKDKFSNQIQIGEPNEN